MFSWGCIQIIHCNLAKRAADCPNILRSSQPFSGIVLGVYTPQEEWCFCHWFLFKILSNPSVTMILPAATAWSSAGTKSSAPRATRTSQHEWGESFRTAMCCLEQTNREVSAEALTIDEESGKDMERSSPAFSTKQWTLQRSFRLWSFQGWEKNLQMCTDQHLTGNWRWIKHYQQLLYHIIPYLCNFLTIYTYTMCIPYLGDSSHP